MCFFWSSGNERNSLNAIKNESNNSLVLYGREMPRVKQLIEENRQKFQHLPRGPFGSYIKLKDKKWAVAVESHLGAGLLSSFTVDNAKDGGVLNNILNSVYDPRSRPSVITSRFFYKVCYDLLRKRWDLFCRNTMLRRTWSWPPRIAPVFMKR